MAADDTPGAKGNPRFRGTGAPATATDLNILSEHAALVGNQKVGTTAERDAATLAGAVWVGLEWYDTTLEISLRWNGAAWRGRTIGTFGADGNATVVGASLERDASGWVDLVATTERTNSTTYEGQLILGVLPVGFRPPGDWFGKALTFGVGTPNDFFINAADGVCTLRVPSPPGHTRARLEAHFKV